MLVVSPLISLMHDQVRSIRPVCGSSPVLLTEEAAPCESELKHCTWSHIFASLKALVEAQKWKGLLLTSKVVYSLVAVVIDETHCIAHCTVKW